VQHFLGIVQHCCTGSKKSAEAPLLVWPETVLASPVDVNESSITFLVDSDTAITSVYEKVKKFGCILALNREFYCGNTMLAKLFLLRFFGGGGKKYFSLLIGEGGKRFAS